MSEPFMSEIRIMSFNFAPQGWAECNGQFMPINQNQALFSLLGTNFGGNGQTTFQLPDFRGRIPMHVLNNSHTLGERGGEVAHTVSIAEMPTHTHLFNVNTGVGTVTNPNGAVLAKAPGNTYGPPTNLVAMNAAATTNTGGSQPHTNMMPYLTLTFCICLQGFFPSPN
jgi:microcystin-dependent protein